MKAIIAISSDGFVAKDKNDDMKWTGMLDKAFFKMYTLQGEALLAGTKTYKILPNLERRVVLPVSRKSFLYYANKSRKNENYICIGGFTLLKAFLAENVITEIVLCYNKKVKLEGEKYGDYDIQTAYHGFVLPPLDVDRYTSVNLIFRNKPIVIHNDEDYRIVMFRDWRNQ